MQLLRRQPVAVLLGRDQRRQQVVGRVRPLPRDDVVDVRVHVAVAVERRLDLLGGDDRVERLDDRPRPSRRCRSWSASGMPSISRDDVEGQRERELADDVATAPLLHRVEDAVDQLLHPRPQRLDRRGVNALLTNRRNRVWSGGSALSMLVDCWSSPPDASRKIANRFSSMISMLASLTLSAGSRSRRETSSYVNSSHWFISVRCTGSWARISAKCGHGSST